MDFLQQPKTTGPQPLSKSRLREKQREERELENISAFFLQKTLSERKATGKAKSLSYPCPSGRTPSLQGHSQPSSHAYSSYQGEGFAQGFRISIGAPAHLRPGDSVAPDGRANSHHGGPNRSGRDIGTGVRSLSRAAGSAGPDPRDVGSSHKSATPEAVRRALIATGVFDGTGIDLQKLRFHPSKRVSDEDHGVADPTAPGDEAPSTRRTSKTRVIHYRDVGTMATHITSPSPAPCLAPPVTKSMASTTAAAASGIALEPPGTDLTGQLVAESEPLPLEDDRQRLAERRRLAALAYVPQVGQSEQPEAPERPESPKSRLLHSQLVGGVERTMNALAQGGQQSVPLVSRDPMLERDSQLLSLDPGQLDMGSAAPSFYSAHDPLAIGPEVFGESSSDYLPGIFSQGTTRVLGSNSSLHELASRPRTASTQDCPVYIPFTTRSVFSFGYPSTTRFGPSRSGRPLPMPNTPAVEPALQGMEDMRDFIEEMEHEVLGRSLEDDGYGGSTSQFDETFGEAPKNHPSPSVCAGMGSSRSLGRPRDRPSQHRVVTRTPLSSLSTNVLVRMGNTPVPSLLDQKVLETSGEDEVEGGLTMTKFWRPNRFAM